MITSREIRTGWPDILVGATIALLFGRSAVHAIRSAWSELRSPQPSLLVKLE